MSSSIFWKLHFLDPPSHIQQHKQIDIMFRITNSTLMDRKYPNTLAYIKIEAVIRVKQKLWAVKIWAKMIWKQPSSLCMRPSTYVHEAVHVRCMRPYTYAARGRSRAFVFSSFSPIWTVFGTLGSMYLNAYSTKRVHIMDSQS